MFKLNTILFIIVMLNFILAQEESEVKSSSKEVILDTKILENPVKEKILESSYEEKDKEKNTDSKEDDVEDKSTIKNDEGFVVSGNEEEATVENEVSEVESFFNNAGFALFPRSRTFTIRNTFSTGISYETDPFLNGENDEDISIFTALGTSFSKQFGRLGVRFNGNLRYRESFTQENQSDVIANIAGNINYTGKRFSVAVSQSFSRTDDFIALDQGENDTIHNSNTSVGLSWNFRRFIFEITSAYNYRKSFDQDEEDQTIRQSFLVGYGLFPGWFLTLNYSWTYIIDDIDNVLAHAVFLGLTIPIDKTISGRFSVGVQFVNENTFFAYNAGLTWLYSSRLQMSFNASASAQSAFGNEFQYNINNSLVANYVYSPRVGISNNLRAFYSIFENGDNDLGAANALSMSYRLTNGIDFDISYILEYRDSQQNDDFINHQINLGITIVF